MLYCAVVFSSFVALFAEGKTCNPHFYGPNCNLTCSPGCKNGACKLVKDGIAPCTDGCEPGWYGSQCNIPCQAPGESCQKCPSECEAGFCQLGSRCVSGCVDSYYGTGCFTCGSDCQVCNKHTGRCYNCTDGCPGTDKKAQIYGSVFGVLIILVGLLVMFLVHRYKRNIGTWPAACTGLFRRFLSRDSNPDASTSRESGPDIHRVGQYRLASYAVIKKKQAKTTGDGYDEITRNEQAEPSRDLYEDIEDVEPDMEDPDGAYDRLKRVS